jgi:site-specific recombinase XerD
MLYHGASIVMVSKLLGHANLDTTAHYAQVSTRLMMESYRSAHPHAVKG